MARGARSSIAVRHGAAVAHARSAVEAAEDAAEWLGQRVDAFTRGLVDGTVACEDKFLAMAFENEKLEEFDNVVSRLGIVSATSKSRWI